MVTLRLGFLAGAKYDPPGVPGLAETTAALLTQGTHSRPARQIAEEVAAIGGQLNAGAGPDSVHGQRRRSGRVHARNCWR